tara:strand:+ start:713 stop:1537 length:825 start_codon:yes stop_codon:yes gene_type:complete
MHYYDIDGKPRHTQVIKSGKRKGELRKTNTRDAKNKKLFPSVSGYTGIVDKPSLSDWKLRETLMVANEMPPIRGESQRQWAQAVQTKANKIMAGPAERGTQLHDAIESRVLNPDQAEREIDAFVFPVIKTLRELCDGTPIAHTEKVVVNAAKGYAGTADVILEDGRIVDYKSKSFKGRDTVDTSKDHPMQLAAYYVAANPTAKAFLPCTNIYFCREKPGKIMVKTWTEAELLVAWMAFDQCCKLFRYINDWDPRVMGNELFSDEDAVPHDLFKA